VLRRFAPLELANARTAALEFAYAPVHSGDFFCWAAAARASQLDYLRSPDPRQDWPWNRRPAVVLVPHRSTLIRACRRPPSAERLSQRGCGPLPAAM